MARLPFNPDRVPQRDTGGPARRERATPGRGAAAEAMSVTQVTLLIKNTLADHTPKPLRIVGEVSNFSDRTHWYLSLKDEQNVISGVMWASAAANAGFRPERGMQVVATGRLDYYGPQGRLQIYIDKLEPVGQGALELKFRQLCDELREAGYFAEERKKPLPLFPERIAVVTSAQGAAISDVVRTAQQRWPGCRLMLVDVPVQGAGAAPVIARAIRHLSDHAHRLRLDAVIVTRGGGSIEDLWAFNERVAADAVFDSAVPIVAAIGHEVDTTVAELVADRRCSTPTQAAAVLVPDAAAEAHRLDQLRHRLGHGLHRAAERRRVALTALARHEVFRRPGGAVELASENLTALTDRLARAGREVCGQRARQLAWATRQLESVGPRSVLARGYSYTTDAQGKLIRKTADARPGNTLVTHLRDGQVRSTVDGPSNKGRRRSKSTDKTTPGLFGDQFA